MDVAKNVYKVDQNLGGGELSFSACPRVGNRPPRKKNIANPRGVCIILVDCSMHNTRLDLVLFVTQTSSTQWQGVKGLRDATPKV